MYEQLGEQVGSNFNFSGRLYVTLFFELASLQKNTLAWHKEQIF